MRLVYVTVATPFGPDEAFIVPEIVEIQKRGHHVTVVPVRPQRSIPHSDALQLTTVAEPMLSWPIIAGAIAEVWRAPVASVRTARLLLASRSAGVLLKNLAVLPKGLWLAGLSRTQRIDHIHAHFASTSATVALIASRLSGIPWSFTAHRWDITDNNLIDCKLRSATFGRAIDRRGAQELATYGPAGEHKLRIIHMGVAPHVVRLETGGVPDRVLKVIIGARFDEMKGHRYAIQAIAHLKASGIDVLLDCAGHGPLRAALEMYAASLGITDSVRFPGLIDHEHFLTDLGRHRWDVALLPSLEWGGEREGIPVFLIEAMAAGIPVVATDTGGIPELLESGGGIIVPQQDARAIAEALTSLAAHADRRVHLALAGQERARAHFTVEGAVTALLDEICSAMRDERAATACAR